MTNVPLNLDPQPSSHDARIPRSAEPVTVDRGMDGAVGPELSSEMGSIAWQLLGAIVFAALVSAVALIVL